MNVSNAIKILADDIDAEVISKYLPTKDFPAVIQAKKYAEYQLRFYNRMMEEKIANKSTNKHSPNTLLYL